MLQWSKYFQTPNYLQLYRMFLMDDDYLPLIAKWINIQNEMKILDVGCGAGAFCFFLSNITERSGFYGVDIDDVFIKSAIERAEQDSSSNHFSFQQADALDLPFDNNSFDMVVSYTALTSIPNGKKALDEMIRVLKNGGLVVSVTAQSFDYSPFGEGDYSNYCDHYIFEYIHFHKLVQQMYADIQPISDYYKYGIRPERIPHLFASSSLKHIEMHPIGNSYSLSNSTYSRDQKIEIINLQYKAEIEKFNSFWELDVSHKYLCDNEAKRYIELLNLHRDFLITTIDINSSWEWYGGSQILMTGQKQTD